MSSFSDYALQILAGGVPAAVDYGTGVPANAQGDTGALGRFSAFGGSGEKTAPRGTLQDRTPGFNTGPQGMSTTTIVVIAGAAALVLVLVVAVTRR